MRRQAVNKHSKESKSLGQALRFLEIPVIIMLMKTQVGVEILCIHDAFNIDSRYCVGIPA